MREERERERERERREKEREGERGRCIKYVERHISAPHHL